ncbi:MAG: hypothetical protein KKD35_05385 [Elusimicrobia bacterium]|nr:hypothetical protein [Elusimicrobiota bacterium]
MGAKSKVKLNPKICIVGAQAFCKSQSVLSSRCFNYFAANGWDMTRNISDADFVIINTCGFVEDLQEYSRKEIKDALREVKKGVKVGVIGCLNKIRPKILKEFPAIRLR